MPVFWLREPLGAIIVCGCPERDGGDGLKLASASCCSRRPLCCTSGRCHGTLRPPLVAQLASMTTSPQPYGAETLRGLGFVANRGTLWWVTPAGVAWLAGPVVERIDLEGPTVAALRGGLQRCRDIARRLEQPSAEISNVLRRLANRGVVAYHEATGWSAL